MTVARVTEITASSPKGIEAAIDEGLKRASKTLRGITGLEIVSIKAKVAKGKVQEYRVSLKITFVLEE
jgi:flavin-binding protein dodecin